MSLLARAVPLLALSFLALFFEITAIRWIPGSVRLMGYYSNLVLIACFLGLGAGMLLVHSPRRLERWFAPLTALLIALCHFSPNLVDQRSFAVVSFLGLAMLAVAMVHHAQLHRSRLVWGGAVVAVLFGALLLRAASAAGGILTWLSQGYVAWGGQGGLSISWLFFVPTVFLLTAAVFACIGQLIGRELERFAPLTGYALNLLGSLLGVLAFSFLSYLSTSPPLWFGLTFAGILPFLVGGEPTRRLPNSVPAVILLATQPRSRFALAGHRQGDLVAVLQDRGRAVSRGAPALSTDRQPQLPSGGLRSSRRHWHRPLGSAVQARRAGSGADLGRRQRQ